MRVVPWLVLGLAAASVACGAGRPTGRRAGEEVVPNACLPRRADYGGRVALTFDDGPNPKTTPTIVRALRARRAPATFFLLGKRVRGPVAEAILRDVAADPLFALGNHTFDHDNLIGRDEAALTYQVEHTEAVVAAALGGGAQRMRVFRFPYGASSARERAWIEARGYCIADVDVDPVDWCYQIGNGRCPPRVDARPAGYESDMIGFLVAELARTHGGIVLMHDIAMVTASSIEPILDAIAGAGYRIVPLAELRAP